MIPLKSVGRMGLFGITTEIIGSYALRHLFSVCWCTRIYGRLCIITGLGLEQHFGKNFLDFIFTANWFCVFLFFSRLSLRPTEEELRDKNILHSEYWFQNSETSKNMRPITSPNDYHTQIHESPSLLFWSFLFYIRANYWHIVTWDALRDG